MSDPIGFMQADCIIITVLVLKMLKNWIHVFISFQSTCGFRAGSWDVGQQNHHQRFEELPQVSLPHQLHVLNCQEWSLAPLCLCESTLLLAMHSELSLTHTQRWLLSEVQSHQITVNYNWAFFFSPPLGVSLSLLWLSSCTKISSWLSVSLSKLGYTHRFWQLQ